MDKIKIIYWKSMIIYIYIYILKKPSLPKTKVLPFIEKKRSERKKEKKVLHAAWALMSISSPPRLHHTQKKN